MRSCPPPTNESGSFKTEPGRKLNPPPYSKFRCARGSPPKHQATSTTFTPFSTARAVIVNGINSSITVAFHRKILIGASNRCRYFSNAAKVSQPFCVGGFKHGGAKIQSRAHQILANQFKMRLSRIRVKDFLPFCCRGLPPAVVSSLLRHAV